MSEGDIQPMKEESPDANLPEIKSLQSHSEIRSLSSGSTTDEAESTLEDLEDVIRAALRKKVADNPLWSDELKQRISNRLIELYDKESKKSKKKALSKPLHPDVEKKKAVDALLEESNKQILATVECRKNIPPQCVEYCVRAARLECTYYKQAGTGPGMKERLEAAKQKYREENAESIAKETERNKVLVKEIEEDTKDMMKVSQALEEKHSNLRKVIDIRATQRKSRVFPHSVKEDPAGLPAIDMPD